MIVPSRIASWLVLALLLVAGCEKELPVEYGRRHGVSVNGVGVFGRLFEQRGHRVYSAARLTPWLIKNADVLVWFPDSGELPTEEVTEWINDWICEAEDRVFIFVPRDYDAAVPYWEKVIPQLPASKTAEANQRLHNARIARSFRRGTIEEGDCWLFAHKRLNPPQQVTLLRGDPEWTADIDPARLEIEVGTVLSPVDNGVVVLDSNAGPLITREAWCDGHVYCVVNGSFLLNLPLVNHEHRILADRLIDQVGEDRRVVFLESKTGDIPISDDNEDTHLGGLAILGVAPFNTIFLHLAALGIILALARLPIFGLPRQLPAEALSDFGKHVAAMGQLLRRTGQRSYAKARLVHYRQLSQHTARVNGARGNTPPPQPTTDIEPDTVIKPPPNWESE